MNVPKTARRARGRPREGDKERQILEAALALFAERGYHGVAVPEVARAAGVGTGTLYHYFESKERLVNAVFRDAKGRLGDALLSGLALTAEPRAAFLDVWARLARFSRDEPVRFQFLEMQDHLPYLDDASRALERAILEPLWLAGRALVGEPARAVTAETLMALVWGALVGVVKAERLGYFPRDDAALARAGEAAWAMVAAVAAMNVKATTRPERATPSIETKTRRGGRPPC